MNKRIKLFFLVLTVIFLSVLVAKVTTGNIFNTSFFFFFVLNIISFYLFGFRSFILLFLTVWYLQFIFPIQYIFFGHIKIFILDIFSTLLIIGYIFDIILKKDNIFRGGIDLLMALLLLIGILSIIRGLPNFKHQAIGEGRSLFFIFIYLVIRRYFKLPKYYKYLKYILLIMFIRSLYNIYLGYSNLMFGGQEIFESSMEGKVYGHILGGANTLIVMMILLIFIIYYEKIEKKWLVLIYSIISVPIILLAQVRTIYISIFSGVLTYIFISKNKISNSFKFLLLAAIVFSIISFIAPETITKSISSAIKSTSNVRTDVNASWRLERAGLEIKRVLDSGIINTLFGLPFGSWFAWNKIGFINEGLSTHIVYVDFFTKMGLIGILILFYIIYLTFRMIFQSKIYLTRFGRLLTLFFSIILVFLISYPGLQDYRVAWFLGAIIGLLNNYKDYINRLKISKKSN